MGNGIIHIYGGHESLYHCFLLKESVGKGRGEALKSPAPILQRSDKGTGFGGKGGER